MKKVVKNLLLAAVMVMLCMTVAVSASALDETDQCGETYIDDYTDMLDHEYKSVITTPATHLTEGVETFTCACGAAHY